MSASGAEGPVVRNRLTSIDMLRGLVLVIMALDHVKDMVTRPLSTDYSAAMDFTTSSGALFFTRWVTGCLCTDLRPACRHERLSLQRDAAAVHRRALALSGEPGRMARLH